MQKLTYVKKGGDRNSAADTVVLSGEVRGYMPYVLNSPQGLGAVETKILSTSAAGQDGTYLQDIVLDPRTVRDDITVTGRTREELYENRVKLISILNPKQGAGTLYYQNDYGEWKIGAIPSVYGDQKGRYFKNWMKCGVEFYCPDPYWLDKEPQKLEIYRYHKGDSFPLTFPVTLQNTAKRQYVLNASEEEAMTKVFAQGPLRGIRILNETTGESLTAEVTLTAEDKLIVDSEKKTIKKIVAGKEKDVIADFGYNYLTIAPGINKILVSFDWTGEHARVLVEWTRRFAGV